MLAKVFDVAGGSLLSVANSLLGIVCRIFSVLVIDKLHVIHLQSHYTIYTTNTTHIKEKFDKKIPLLSGL